MKLHEARICIDCEEIFVLEVVEYLGMKAKTDHCPSCGSRSHCLLRRWIPTMEDMEYITKNKPLFPKEGQGEITNKKEGSGGFIPWNPERMRT